ALCEQVSVDGHASAAPAHHRSNLGFARLVTGSRRNPDGDLTYVIEPYPSAGGSCAISNVQPAATSRSVSATTSSTHTPTWCTPGTSFPSHTDPGSPCSSSTCCGPSRE